MILEPPPGLPVVFRVHVSGGMLYRAAARAGFGGTQMFWRDGFWRGPGAGDVDDLAFRIAKCVRPLWAKPIPDGLPEALARALRDPAALIAALDVMSS